MYGRGEQSVNVSFGNSVNEYEVVLVPVKKKGF